MPPAGGERAGAGPVLAPGSAAALAEGAAVKGGAEGAAVLVGAVGVAGAEGVAGAGAGALLGPPGAPRVAVAAVAFRLPSQPEVGEAAPREE